MSGAIVWFRLASPVVVWLAAWALRIPAGLATALVLMTAAPPIMAGPAFALLIGLDVSLSLVTMLAATLIVRLTLPLVAVGLLSLELAIDASALMARLAILIGASLILGVLGRRVLGARRLQRWSGEIDGAAVVIVVVFGIAIMDGVADRLLAAPGHVLFMTAVTFAVNVALQAAGTAVFRGAGPLGALTNGLSSGNRNMGLLLAVLPTGVHPD